MSNDMKINIQVKGAYYSGVGDVPFKSIFALCRGEREPESDSIATNSVTAPSNAGNSVISPSTASKSTSSDSKSVTTSSLYTPKTDFFAGELKADMTIPIPDLVSLAREVVPLIKYLIAQGENYPTISNACPKPVSPINPFADVIELVSKHYKATTGDDDHKNVVQSARTADHNLNGANGDSNSAQSYDVHVEDHKTPAGPDTWSMINAPTLEPRVVSSDERAGAMPSNFNGMNAATLNRLLENLNSFVINANDQVRRN